MIYELWDYDAANIIDTYQTQEEALAVVAGQINAFGRQAVATWILLANDGTERENSLRRIAFGDDLANLAPHQFVRVRMQRTAD